MLESHHPHKRLKPSQTGSRPAPKKCVYFWAFYRVFVPLFSNIAGPLIALINKTIPFTWESKHQEAFINLKRYLISLPILDYLHKNDHFVSTTDASDTGMGAILLMAKSSVIEYAEEILCYHSKRMPCSHLGSSQILSVSDCRSLPIGNRPQTARVIRHC